MNQARRLLLTTASLAAMALSVDISAHAYAIKGKIYVSTTGDDNNSCMTVALPCKTITKAFTLAAPAWDIVPAAGTYYENVVITNSGTSNSGPIRMQPAAGTKVVIDGSQGDSCHRAVVEITGSYVFFNGGYVTGGKQSGVYVHGVDQAHPSVGVHFNLAGIYGNALYNIEATDTTNLHFGYGRYFNSGKENIMLVRSPHFLIGDNNVYNSGSTTQNPPTTPLPGMIAIDSPNGEYEGNTGKVSGNSINLIMNNSPFSMIVDNKPGVGTFTYQINPASDEATDTISGNN